MKFSTRKKYVRTDGWRGYFEPVYAIAGYNDTGSADDSPCRTVTGQREAARLKAFLKSKGIHFKTITCLTTNVCCIHHYIIAPIEQYEAGKIISKQWCVENHDSTSLIYACGGAS